MYAIYTLKSASIESIWLHYDIYMVIIGYRNSMNTFFTQIKFSPQQFNTNSII